MPDHLRPHLLPFLPALALFAAGCFGDYDLTGKDQCVTHADCVGQALCVVEEGEALGTCTPSGGGSNDTPANNDDDDPDNNDGPCADQPCEVGQPVCVDEGNLADCVADDDGCGTLAAPVACPAGFTCSSARCIEPEACVDEDGDGYGDDCPPGDDCDDNDPGRYPTNEELCDDIDQDCDGQVMEGFDTTSDVEHCGACQSPCQGDNAAWRCVASTCVVERCQAGYVDADGEADNGCEAECEPTFERELNCTDAVDDDCDSAVDGDDDDCIVAREPMGPYRAIHLQRTDFTSANPSETSIQTRLAQVEVNQGDASFAVQWVGSPLLPGSGFQDDTLFQKTLDDLGSGRYLLTPEGGGDSTTLRAFASRDEPASLFAAVPTTNADPPMAWGVALWLFGRQSALEAERFDGDYLGALFRGRTEEGSIRPVSFTPTWFGDYVLKGNSPGHELTAERSGDGPPLDADAYPLDLQLGRDADGSFWLKRERAGQSWDVGFYGELLFDGAAALFASYTEDVCPGMQLERNACPPDAGVTYMIQPAPDARHAIEGRWALVGAWIDRANEIHVQGTPAFLALDLRVTRDGLVIGAGDYDALGEIGRASQDGATLELDLDGLTSQDGQAPATLNLDGVMARDGLTALFAIDSLNRPDDGVFVLIRL